MATNGGLPSIPPDVAKLTGPLFLGHIFNWGLFGALSVQVYMYYIAFPHDKLLPKAIVVSTYLLEVLQVCMSISDGFRNFGTGWGNMEDLDTVGLLWFSVPVLGSITQLFYAWRIWILGRQPVILAAIIIIAMIQLGFGVYAGAEAHIIGDFTKLQAHTFQTTAVWLGAAAVDDIIIATCMIYYLHRSNTGFRQTSTLLSKFIRLTLETGLICATFAILDLSFYCAFQTNNYHLAPSIPLSKLYSNSLLVVLNARMRIKGGREFVETLGNSGTISYVDASRDSPHATSRKTRPRSTLPGPISGISVSIAHETHADRAMHIPMNDLDNISQPDMPKYDAAPLDIPSGTVDVINKGAHLV